MGYGGCPCYKKFLQAYGYRCDDDDNGMDCSECPFLAEARKENGY